MGDKLGCDVGIAVVEISEDGDDTNSHSNGC